MPSDSAGASRSSGDPQPTDRINQYSLVTYVPGHLGEFLNNLRLELVPRSVALAHVTVLPPRSLQVDDTQAASRICYEIGRSQAFRIGVAELQVFSETDVIYAEIGRGRESLLDLHYHMNAHELAFVENYPYHPHVTLAQHVDHSVIPELYELALRRWREYRHERVFLLDHVTFVQNTVENRWIDLASYRLNRTKDDTASDKR